MARHIACQTLLDGEPLRYGWLRRQDLLHQKVKWNLVKTIKWPKVFVVVDNCFLYMYNNEQSEKPSKFIHLFYATDVLTKFDTDTSECPWSFALVNQATHKGTTYIFAAASQKEMTEWVNVLKDQLKLAKERGPKAPPNLEEDDSDDESDNYDKLGDENMKARLGSLGRKFIETMVTSKRTPAPPPLRTADTIPELPHTPEPPLYADRGMADGSPSGEEKTKKPDWGRQASEPGPPTGGADMHATNRPLSRILAGARQVMPIGSEKPAISPKDPLLKPWPPVVPELHSNDGDGDIEYTDTRDVGPRPLNRSVPLQRPEVSKKPSLLVRPLVAPGPTSVTEEENPYELELDDEAVMAAATWTRGDKEGHELISRCKEDGVFLLRKSTQCPGQQTLVSHVGGMAKKYRIGELAPGSNQFTLDVGKPDPRYFTGMSQLVGHYMKEPLPSPGYEVCLSKPFSELTN